VLLGRYRSSRADGKHARLHISSGFQRLYTLPFSSSPFFSPPHLLPFHHPLHLCRVDVNHCWRLLECTASFLYRYSSTILGGSIPR
ncbi:hypothetical protein PFISCL1PPCAC_24583, partial [Pristionchus fissidentatus]